MEHLVLQEPQAYKVLLVSASPVQLDYKVSLVLAELQEPQAYKVLLV
jgi:hypothetical protein